MKVRSTTPSFQKIWKSHKIKNRASIVMKIITIKGQCLLHWCTKFHIDIWSRLWVIGLWNVENQIHTHTHTPGRQLKITFIDVLDYSEYLDTNIRKKKISRKHSFLSEEAKTWKNCIYWYSSTTARWLKIYWICDTSCDRLLHVRQNWLHFAIHVHCT